MAVTSTHRVWAERHTGSPQSVLAHPLKQGDMVYVGRGGIEELRMFQPVDVSAGCNDLWLFQPVTKTWVGRIPGGHIWAGEPRPSSATNRTAATAPGRVDEAAPLQPAPHPTSSTYEDEDPDEDIFPDWRLEAEPEEPMRSRNAPSTQGSPASIIRDDPDDVDFDLEQVTLFTLAGERLVVQLSKDATIGQLVSKLRPLVNCEQLSLWQRQGRIVTRVGEPMYLDG